MMGQGEELAGINLTMLLIYLQLFTAYRIKSKVCGMTYAYQGFMTFPSLIFHKLSLSTLLCAHRSPSLYMEPPIPITLCHPIPLSHPSVPRLTSPSNPSKAPGTSISFPQAKWNHFIAPIKFKSSPRIPISLSKLKQLQKGRLKFFLKSNKQYLQTNPV